MQTLKNELLYRSILINPDHWFETSVFIGEGGDLITEYGDKITFGTPEHGGAWAIAVVKSGPEYGTREANIRSISTSNKLFDKSMEIGSTPSGEIDLVLEDIVYEIPTMAKIVPYVRAICLSDDGTEEIKSEWIQQGVFFVDTREITKNDDGLNILTIHGYDAMLKFEQEFEDENGSWPNYVDPETHEVADYALDTDVVIFIANKIGINVDYRTWEIMTDEFHIPLPMGYTLREVLGYIAGAYAGCFIINEVGDLRLLSVADMPQPTNYLIDEVGNVITFGRDESENYQGSFLVVNVTDADPESVGYESVKQFNVTFNYLASGYTGITIEFVHGSTTEQIVADWSPSVEKIYGGTWDVLTGYVIELYDADGNELLVPNHYQVMPYKVEYSDGMNTFLVSDGTMSMEKVTNNSVRILI